jgi:hypothetical protein
MPIWEIEFYPAKGERNSPADKLEELCKPDDKAEFVQKFKVLRELEFNYWQFKWLKIVRGFYQIHQGDFRGYFKLYKRKIVVFHFCRKVGKKTKEADIKVAQANCDRYQKG